MNQEEIDAYNSLKNTIKESAESLFDDNSKFILKYLEKRWNHKAVFDNLILRLNGIDVNIESFISGCSPILFSSFVKILEEGDGYYTLKLMDSGYKMAKNISIEKPIILKTLTISIIILIALFTFRFVPNSISKAQSIFTMSRIINFGVIIGIIVGVVQLWIWYKEGRFC